MTIHRRIDLRALALAVLVLAGAPGLAFAQTDEIQVYDGGLAAKGVFNLTLHSNFIANGASDPAFPGALIADKTFDGVPEWALGVTDWFEAGLYMPLYSVGKKNGSRSALIDGAKLRLLFAVPNADDRKFFYGANFEFSLNAKHWDSTRFTSEIRPIVGWHLHPVDVIFNPILDTAYDGIKNLDFAPSTRVAYNLPDMATAVAVEEYADFGPLHKFLPASEQSHQLFAVFDRTTKAVDIEAGVGFGLNDASDKFTMKLILSRDLNKK
jgi:hypothetical protein